jgi:hypothetical protein
MISQEANMLRSTARNRLDRPPTFYRNVPELGHVAVNRHAQKGMREDNISQEAFERVLLEPIQPDIPDGMGILLRERDGIRLVIRTDPAPDTGATVITVYRIEAQAKVK